MPPRRPWTLVNWLVWASLLLYPFFRFLSNMISSGSSLTLASFVLVFFVGKSRARGWREEGAAALSCRAACDGDGPGGAHTEHRTAPSRRKGAPSAAGRLDASDAHAGQPGGRAPCCPFPARAEVPYPCATAVTHLLRASRAGSPLPGPCRRRSLYSVLPSLRKTFPTHPQHNPN